MHKYHFNIRLDNVRYNHAGSKAVEDCKSILLDNGFENIEVSFIKALYMMPLNLLKLVYLLAKYAMTIKPQSLVLTQYPLLGINKYFKYFASLIKGKQCKLVCIIHDLDSIRSTDSSQMEQEIIKLNVYDAVIAHNDAMADWLVQHSYRGEITRIQLFDYLTPFDNSNKPAAENRLQIAFAGNLARTQFVADLNKLQPSVKFNLYGPGLDDASKTQLPANIVWMGVFSPEQIVDELHGAFGMIWDGTSINECTGVMGNYLRYNTPHKTSLYLVSGLPVIVPQTSAIAAYVLQQRIGVAVNSLHELENKLSEISAQEYMDMRNNAFRVSQKLRAGAYLKASLDSVAHL